jgi:hypothetical protein
MYFRSGQYPMFKGLPRGEQRRIVHTAITKHDKHAGARVIAVALTLVAIACAISPFAPSAFVLVGAVAVGAIFYAYLLWEINGLVLRAVTKFTSENPDA